MARYLIDPLGEHYPVPASELRSLVRSYRADGCSLAIAMDYATDDLRREYRLDDDRLASRDRYWREASRI